jgi:hypothetical protein
MHHGKIFYSRDTPLPNDFEGANILVERKIVTEITLFIVGLVTFMNDVTSLRRRGLADL